jgi:uncharacterized protein
MPASTAQFRFYAELNDFLPAEKRMQAITYCFKNNPAIKDPIEALGVPHTEIELIIVNGRSVGFDYRLADGDRVAVYPVFEAFDVTPLVRLRERPLREPRFVVDSNLGKLARWLRLLGFDTLYSNNFSDAGIARLSAARHRILLTRDRFLLRQKIITHAHWVRAQNPDAQVVEVIRRFDLGRQISPFRRCLECNGVIEKVAKSTVIDQLKPLTRRYYDIFYRCSSCHKVYWKGPHYQKLLEKVAELRPDDR